MKLFILIFLFFFSFGCFAQERINYPDLSYRSTLHQKVGFTNFIVDYERPMQRGRALFGSFIPYGKPWRTGAGFQNTISFDTEVSMGGKKIPPGTYLLITIPDKSIWKVILSSDSNAFSKNKPYEVDKEVVRIDANVEKASRHFEAMTIAIDIVNNEALFTVSWDYTSVSFTIATGTTDKIMTQINEMIKSGKADEEQNGEAADFIAYNLTSLGPSEKDKAILLIDKALASKPKAWMFRTKRNVYWFSKDFKGYEKTSKAWITFLQEDKSDDHSAEIRMIENDLITFKTVLK